MKCLPPVPARAALGSPLAEVTTTVIIGSGLPGLAVASELSRRGIESITVEGLECLDSGAFHAVTGDSMSLSERSELLRLLRGYAASHHLDVRPTFAEDLSIIGYSELLPTPVCGSKKWAVQTANGVLLADHVVLTKYPQNRLRRFLRSMGIAIGKDFRAALRAIGLHLVGVGELLTPTTREIVRQAKLVGDAISAEARGSAIAPNRPALTALHA